MTAIQRPNNLLMNALRSNAVFSELSGLIGVVAAGPLARFMGLPTAGRWVLLVIGLLLIGHGAILWLGSGRQPIPTPLAWYAILGDIGWVLGSIWILLADPWSLTSGGWWLVVILADIVGLFAILQYIGLRRTG